MDSEARSPDHLLEELKLLRRRVAELEDRELDRDRPGEGGDLFRRLVEHSLGLMCIHDLDGNLPFLNPAAARSLGFRPEDGVGLNLRRFLSPSVENQVDAYLERIRANSVDSGLMRLVAKDGTERIWMYRNVRYEERGKPPRVFGHAQDVTDAFRAEQALKESERRFRLLADTAPVLIWMSDPTGGCAFLNRPWLDFTGQALEAQLGEGWIESIHPDDRARFLAAYREAIAARADFQVEYRLRRAGGEHCWVLGTGVPRIEADGASRGSSDRASTSPRSGERARCSSTRATSWPLRWPSGRPSSSRATSSSEPRCSAGRRSRRSWPSRAASSQSECWRVGSRTNSTTSCP